MKKALVTTVLFLFAATSCVNAQTYKNSVSVYIDASLEAQSARNAPHLTEHQRIWGVQYNRMLTANHGIQGYVGYSNLKDLSFGADYIFNLPLVAETLSMIAGVGVGKEVLDKDTRSVKKTYTLFRPQAGFDFRLPQVPLGVFAVYKPKIDLDGFEPIDTSSIQAGIRFYF